MEGFFAHMTGGDQYVYIVLTWGENGQQREFGPYDTQSDDFRPEQAAEEVEAWMAEHPDRPVKGRQMWGFKTIP